MDFNKDSEYFANQQLYNKIIKKDNSLPYDKNEYRFYKKRILQLVKDIMRKKETTNEIVIPFNNFVVSAIEHFKFEDKKSIIQSEYEEIECDDNKGVCKRVKYEDVESGKDKNETISKLEEGNSLMMKNMTIKTMTIEGFLPLVRTQLKPVEQPQMPQQKNYNLKDPKFRTKGVEEKNLNKVYSPQKTNDKTVEKKDTKQEEQKSKKKNKDT